MSPRDAVRFLAVAGLVAALVVLRGDALHFWSPHPGGANFGFADGSVRFLSYAADEVLPALATRAGNEGVSAPD